MACCCPKQITSIWLLGFDYCNIFTTTWYWKFLNETCSPTLLNTNWYSITLNGLKQLKIIYEELSFIILYSKLELRCPYKGVRYTLNWTWSQFDQLFLKLQKNVFMSFKCAWCQTASGTFLTHNQYNARTITYMH